jgi:hypothetical protein
MDYAGAGQDADTSSGTIGATSIFTPDTAAAFLEYTARQPNNSRMSRQDEEDVIGWLTNPNMRPSTQAEFSRRGYVKKAFSWDESSRQLWAKPKVEQGKDNPMRMVVTEDRIVEIVEYVHLKVQHAGWDATWKALSVEFYGIPRDDMSFLLKRCEVCQHNPRNQPKQTYDGAKWPVNYQSKGPRQKKSKARQSGKGRSEGYYPSPSVEDSIHASTEWDTEAAYGSSAHYGVLEEFIEPAFMSQADDNVQ